MSATSFVFDDALSIRSQAVKPGVKKFAKTALARAQRREAGKQLHAEVEMLTTATSLHEMSPLDLERYADSLLLTAQSDESLPLDLDADFCDHALQAFTDLEPAELPSYLQGALPDWMLGELEAAKGDAFVLLSMFEAKSPSPKAAFLMDDEAQYA